MMEICSWCVAVGRELFEKKILLPVFQLLNERSGGLCYWKGSHCGTKVKIFAGKSLIFEDELVMTFMR